MGRREYEKMKTQFTKLLDIRVPQGYVIIDATGLDFEYDNSSSNSSSSNSGSSRERMTRNMSKLGVYIIRLFIHLILWCYHSCYNNKIKYFLCNIKDTNVKKPYFIDNNNNNNKDNYNDNLKCKIWNLTDREISEWLLNSQIKRYFQLF